MRINDRSKSDFDRAKIKLTGHFDRRPTGRYFEPCKYPHASFVCKLQVRFFLSCRFQSFQSLFGSVFARFDHKIQLITKHWSSIILYLKLFICCLFWLPWVALKGPLIDISICIWTLPIRSTLRLFHYLEKKQVHFLSPARATIFACESYK